MSNWILVKGDISGIQDFIFNVKSEGAAQELKGRSFFIKLLNEIGIRYFLDEFNILDINNSKISVSGGNFILKLPEVSGFKNKINNIQKSLSLALQYTGLNISISYVLASGNYKKDLNLLNLKNRENKYHFHNLYQFYIPFQKNNTIYDWGSITENLKKNNAFTIEKQEIAGTFQIQKNKISICNYLITFNANNIGYILSDYLESLMALYDNKVNIKKFEDLARSDKIYKDNIEILGGEKGAEYLGILAMDVDGLGNYIDKIEAETEHKDFDLKLNNFFNYKLRDIITNEEFSYEYENKKSKIKVPLFKNKIYSVTAGGDDSFFVGKWNTILKFAKTIHEEFINEFSQEQLTISAAIVIVNKKFPVVRFAEMVENDLKRAKYNFSTKGNISLFGEVIKWEILNDIEDFMKKLQRQKISGGILAKARNTALSIENYDRLKLEDFWKMGYYLRDVKDKQLIISEINKFIENSINAQEQLEKKSYRSILPMAARIVELNKR